MHNRSLFRNIYPYFMILAFALSIGIFWKSASVYALPAHLKSDVKIQVDDELVQFAEEAAPFIDDDHKLQVHVRTIAEAIGYHVSWSMLDEQLVVSLAKEGQELTLITDETYALYNGEPVEMTSPATLVDSKLYVPVRFITDTLDILLQWDEQNHLAILSLNGEYRAPAWYAPRYEVIEVNATAYSASKEENGGWGAVDYFGNQLELGTIAVDPSVIPLGSKIFITGYDFEHLPDGGMMGTALDIGGGVKGERIDIFVPAPRDQVRMFGKQKVKVYIFD